MRTARLLSAAAVAAALTAAGPAAASRCPTETFLSFDHLAYVAKPLPASVQMSPGDRLGPGTIDEPTSADGCKRRRESAPVRRVDGIAPGVAVMVQGRLRTVFVLGKRCAGSEGARYWDCLLHPLRFAGRSYTGTSYPARAAPRGTVPVRGALGKAELGGRTVTVVRIAGVDPSLAVGVRGRPSEAFLAASVCPYEGFENVTSEDDLLRCLQSPVWFAFDPPGGKTGDEVVATSDRPLAPVVAGATVMLVRLPVVADLVPRNRKGAARIGTAAARLRVTLPDVPPGLYEAVVACRRCAASHGGRTLFPAGSVLISRPAKGSSGPRIVSFGLGLAVLGLAVASLVVWRRGRRRPPSAAGPAGS